MPENFSKVFLALGLGLCVLVALWLAVLRPAYLNYTYLGGLVFLEIMAVVLWKFEKRFLPFLMIVFLLAGMMLPLRAVWTSVRWVVLGIGAVSGYVMYLKGRHHSFGIFHMFALFSVIAALVSAIVSVYPRVALLKVLSLFLLFAYAATGARVAVIGREAKFFRGLLLACELMVYFSAVCYFVLHAEVFGNPNSLGLIMGVAAAPVLLWGVFISQGTPTGTRRTFALVLSLVLLFSSYARAGIAAGVVSCALLCLALRQYRLLIKGLGVAVLAAVVVATAIPVLPSYKEGQAPSFVSAFLYKGGDASEIMQSRVTPWQNTSSVIRAHPWFGAGFGTSATLSDAAPGTFESTLAGTREHGNSYLAILEWVGLLGVIPFLVLIWVLLLNLGRVWTWIHRTQSPFSPAVPLAAVLVAGLTHATFEDWLFAVGSYMCVFFWVLAFVLIDVLRSPAPMPAHAMSPDPSRPWASNYGIATPSQ